MLFSFFQQCFHQCIALLVLAEGGRGREGESKGPLWLLIVLISPLDSSLIALLCLQGHHYSDQAQLCFSLLFMNIILQNNCFEVSLTGDQI